ncbi:TPA: 2-oxoacid:ferredoxin oxidoreductase subunit beta [Candidatus Bipolaricaulota bacterium]|nr:2-oxoacid:ferredoxin oxidoreductase subunit beta [Candidatus Bipolaricaulota bacterium]
MGLEIVRVLEREPFEHIREEVLPTPFCPGCGHGIILGALDRAIEELKLDPRRLLFVSGIGCAAWIPSPHLAADTLHVTHGRPIAFATGAKLAKPELKVVVVSGDGDLAAIGGNHLIHAARRAIEMVVICANNAVYGMTGGQASPTTPPGARTSTTPRGCRERAFDLCRLVAAAGAAYVARYTVLHVRQLQRAIIRALEHQGFSFIEVISPCPTEYGRRNRLGGPEALMELLQEQYIPQGLATGLSEEEARDKVLIGEFVGGEG